MAPARPSADLHGTQPLPRKTSTLHGRVGARLAALRYRWDLYQRTAGPRDRRWDVVLAVAYLLAAGYIALVLVELAG